MINDFCFIITSFDQVKLIEENIVRIRANYPAEIKNAPIIIVSTAEKNLFKHIVEQKNLFFIHFKDAPSNSSNTTFKSKAQPTGNYEGWRNEFLPPRILMSIEKALDLAYKIKCNSALHLHSDTYWRVNKTQNLLNEIRYKIKNKLFIGDLSFPNEYSSFIKKVLPPFLHFQPEGLLFNVKKSKEIGFSDFSRIWDNKTEFKSHNYGSIEALIGQFAYFSLTGNNVINKKTKLINDYFSQIGFRTIRPYHGHFNYGLTNLDEVMPSQGLLSLFTPKIVRFYLKIFKN